MKRIAKQKQMPPQFRSISISAWEAKELAADVRMCSMANKNPGFLANTVQEEPCGDCSKIWLSFIFALMVIYYFEYQKSHLAVFYLWEGCWGNDTDLCVLN